MSHIVKMSVSTITNLDALARAAEAVGTELVRDQHRFKAYFNDERNNCAHLIRVPGDARAYEVGVVLSADGKGYELRADEFNNGYGMVNRVGTGCQTLGDHYAAHLAGMEYENEGYTVNYSTKEDGAIVMHAARY